MKYRHPVQDVVDLLNVLAEKYDADLNVDCAFADEYLADSAAIVYTEHKYGVICSSIEEYPDEPVCCANGQTPINT